MPRADETGNGFPHHAAEPAEQARSNPWLGLAGKAGDVVCVGHQVSVVVSGRAV